MASIVVHVLFVTLFPVLERLLPTRREQLRNVRVAAFEPLRIRIPEPLYLSRQAVRRATSHAGPRGAAAAGKRGSAPRQPRAPAGADGERRVAARRTFQLPPLPVPLLRDQTLLQPISPPEAKLPVDLHLPQMTFWSAAPVTAPRPPAKKFVMPGRSSPQARPAELASPRRLELADAEIKVGDLKVAALQIVKVNPALPVPAGTPMPMANPAETAARSVVPPAAESTTGEPVNVLALNPNPASLTEIVVVPPGNQLSALHASMSQSQVEDVAVSKGSEIGEATGQRKESSGGGNVSDSGSGSGSGAGSSSGAGRGSGRGPGDETGGGGGMARSETGPGGRGGSGQGGSRNGAEVGSSGDENGKGGGQSSGGVSGGRTGAIGGDASMGLPAVGVPTRIVHPANGVFDIVVQSASGELLAETTGILTGRPVYTVYLRVGAAKDWILQYCAPQPAARNNGPIVQLGSPSPLRAPFPRTTVIPSAEVFARSSRTFLRGFLTENGQFRELEAVRADEAEVVSKLLPFLKQWEFRPATRNGKPVEVELLLVIPSAGS